MVILMMMMIVMMIMMSSFVLGFSHMRIAEGLNTQLQLLGCIARLTQLHRVNWIVGGDHNTDDSDSDSEWCLDDDVINRDDCDDEDDYYEDFECVSTSVKKSAIYYNFNDLNNECLKKNTR